MAQAQRKKAPAAPAPADAIIDAALALAAERGWAALSLSDIAAEAGVSLSELSEHYSSKSDILIGYSRRLDAEILANEDPELLEQPVRDRLFDVVMQRLEAMEDDKPALRRIVKDLRSDPFFLPGTAGAGLEAIGWMLEAAGIDTDGLRGLVRKQVMGGVFLHVFTVWLGEDSADLSKTMAVLDRDLRRVERGIETADRLRSIFGGSGRRQRPEDGAGDLYE